VIEQARDARLSLWIGRPWTPPTWSAAP